MSARSGGGAEPVEEYYPAYVDESEVEFDYAYYQSRCGWTSDPVSHPKSTQHKEEAHTEYGQTVDCGLGKHVIVFEDGGVAEV